MEGRNKSQCPISIDYQSEGMHFQLDGSAPEIRKNRLPAYKNESSKHENNMGPHSLIRTLVDIATIASKVP